MSDRINIEELVRGKLDKAEIAPSADAWKGVQRQLRMKQFVRFHPGQFNVYYLGGLAAAGVVALTLIFNGLATDEFKPVPQKPGSQMVESLQQENEAGPEARSLAVAEEQEARSPKKVEGETGAKAETGRKSKDPGLDAPVAEEDPLQEVSQQTQDGEQDGDVREVQQRLVTYFTVSSLSGCAPLQVNFVNSSVNAVSSFWSFGTGETTTENNPSYTFTQPGKYTVTLSASGRDGISELYSQVVEVFPVPDAEFEIEEGLVGVNGVETLELMNYSTGAFSYAWDFPGQKGQVLKTNEFQPILKTKDLPEAVRMVRLVATNSKGCMDTSLVEIPAMAGSAARELKFPTAFNANHTGPTGGSYNPNDMRIDVFHPHFTEVPGVYHLQIFSRMGELVFESRDIYTGWDGYVREEQAAGGVYLWVAEGNWENGEVFSQRGDVTLLWSDRRWP